ncbi:MAG: polymer-forming cytoskeletal protein [Sphingobacteriales bacterium]|nr:MAG: polymer-forming cytoskeletal protein [Sphingobacteriales bacterium]
MYMFTGAGGRHCCKFCIFELSLHSPISYQSMLFKKSNKEQKAAARFADKVSIVAAGMSIVGEIQSDGDIRIDGSIIGNVYCNARVVVVGTGRVDGDIEAVNIDIHGRVTGNVKASDTLTVKSNAIIEGDILCSGLQIEPNATFNGQCRMKDQPDAETEPVKKESRLRSKVS